VASAGTLFKKESGLLSYQIHMNTVFSRYWRVYTIWEKKHDPWNDLISQVWHPNIAQRPLTKQAEINLFLSASKIFSGLLRSIGVAENEGCEIRGFYKTSNFVL